MSDYVKLEKKKLEQEKEYPPFVRDFMKNIFAADNDTEENEEKERNFIMLKRTKKFQTCGIPEKFFPAALTHFDSLYSDMKINWINSENKVFAVKSNNLFRKIIESSVSSSAEFFRFFGNRGSGKTCLACAILHEIALNSSTAVKYCKMNDLLERIQQKGFGTIRDELLKSDFIILDNLGLSKLPELEQYHFNNIIQEFYENGKKAIFISSANESVINSLFSEVFDYFAKNGIFQFCAESFRGKKNELFTTILGSVHEVSAD